MGHFGRRPIRLAWFTLVLPALMFNYFGQAALLLESPSAVANPFYELVPHPFLYPMVVLATIATIVASQALISGAFSLTQQAVQLGFSPRMTIIHTSEKERGQIYVPEVNFALMVACIWLVSDLSFVHQPRRRVRHRGHWHYGDYYRAVRRGCRTEMGVESGARLGSLRVVSASWTWPSSRQTSSSSGRAAGSRSSSRSASSR